MIDARELATFAAVPAPTGAEEQRIAWLEARLDGAPGVRRRDDAGNLVWSFGDGRPELLVMAHVDTVFDADTELRFTRDGDFLVGPGVGDNATAVMATVWALEQIEPPDGLVVAFTVGEEGLGNLRGARQACADLSPVSAIAVEGHGLDHVVIEHVGSVRARLAVTGPGGHSWRDRGTPSALHALIALGDELVDDGVNIGRMSGGGAVNAIASAAEMLVELRSVDDAVLTAFEARLGALAVPAPLALECEVVGRRGAGQIAAGRSAGARRARRPASAGARRDLRRRLHRRQRGGGAGDPGGGDRLRPRRGHAHAPRAHRSGVAGDWGAPAAGRARRRGGSLSLDPPIVGGDSASGAGQG